MTCPSCNSTDVVPEKNFEGKKFLRCRNCGNMWKYMSDLDTAAMGSRRSRIERLAGQILAATVTCPDDLYKLEVDRKKTDSMFVLATQTAERFVDWFDVQEWLK
jgi:uncharacterized Zn finger protein